MEAKLEMVSGSCQHRLCSSCLYLDNGCLRRDMHKCPVCGKCLAFPLIRPNIPEDNIEIQKYLGVRECPNKDWGCKFQMWDWEMDDHMSTCQFKKPRTPYLRKSSGGVTESRSVSRSSKSEVTYTTRAKRSLHESTKLQHPVNLRRSPRSVTS